MGWVDRLVNKAGNFVDRLFPKWEELKDTERNGDAIYVYRTTQGDYIVQNEGDGTWSWVLVESATSAPVDLGAKLPTVDAAKASAEMHHRGEVSHHP